jgi:hypothetical protein
MTFVKERNILLRKLANYAVENNLYRKRIQNRDGDVFFEITPQLLKKMSRGMSIRITKGIEDGYMFLDENRGNFGLIRLHLNEEAETGQLNPKWIFKLENNKVKLYQQ